MAVYVGSLMLTSVRTDLGLIAIFDNNGSHLTMCVSSVGLAAMDVTRSFAFGSFEPNLVVASFGSFQLNLAAAYILIAAHLGSLQLNFTTAYDLTAARLSDACV
jgi:hypothetical protein